MATAVISKTALLTAESLVGLPDDEFFYELDEGVLIRMSPANELHGRSEVDLTLLLGLALMGRNLGRLYPSDTAFVLQRDPDIVRCPDIAFVKANRLPLPISKRGGFILGPPDLAVEILSPSQSRPAVARKIQQYFDAGTSTVWDIDPVRRVAEIHEVNREVRTIGIDGDLTSIVLPEIEIPLREALGGDAG